MIKNLKNKLPFYLAACWALLILANFVPTFPQPNAIIGYLWKVEFALAAFLLTAIVLIYKYAEKSALQISRNEFIWILLPLLLFTAWSGFSVFWSESVRNAIHHTLLWSCYIVFYLQARQIISNPRNLDVSLKCAAVVLLILGAACIVEYTSNAEQIGSNFTFRYYKYAEIAATLLPLFLIGTFKSDNSKAFLSGTVALVCWAMVVLCLSRTVLIAGSAGIILFFGLILLKPTRKKYFKKSLVLGVLFVAIFSASQFNLSSGVTTIQRFGNNKDANSSLDFRYLSWGIAVEQLKSAPITGVGADNYVTQYKSARENFSASRTENKLIESSETVLPERAHNEFLQILAELGIVGFLLFGLVLFAVLRIAFDFRKGDFSLVSIAAFAGIAAFLISSQASSYSFRLPANGLCFFFLLAVLASKLKNSATKSFSLSAFRRPIFATSLCICVAMLAFSTVRGISLMYVQSALLSNENEPIEENFQKAIVWDESDAMIRFLYGSQLFNSKKTDESITHLRFGIDQGIATSVAYFTLASAQIVAGKSLEAEETLSEAVRVYPRSIFLLTAYASVLEQNKKLPFAENQYEKAFQINNEQARSWRLAFTEGIQNLTMTEGQDKQFVKAMDLQPTEGVYALLDFQRQFRPKLVRR